MREILFRGRIKENKSEHEELNWAFGDLIRELETGRCFISDLSHFDGDTKLSDVILEVYPETVCQYTGLTDKNGRKIFEGDCLGHKQNVVEYLSDSFVVSGDRLLSMMVKYNEVVGNIFDKE